MSAQIYVGKNVSVKIQTPVLEEVFGKLTDIYDFKMVNNGSSTHRASDQESSSEPSPTDGGWTEFANDEYDDVERSDDTRHSFTTTNNGNYALMLFRFLCAIAEADVKKIVLTFEGYGTAPGGNGVTIKVWNHVSSGWENAQAGTGSGDEEIAITLTSNLGNYIDGSGFIYLLARTTNTDNGTTNAVLYCDYVKCFVTQAKFTVDHTPISDRDLDGVANEAAHVTVKKNGTEVTVSSVNDSTGQVELASGDFAQTDNITCSYRYDVDPYVAQELRIEPSREIQGLDGLGSDEIQLWALLLRELNGVIREVFHGKAQLNRIRLLPNRLGDRFDAYDTAMLWTTVTGTPDIYAYDGEQTLRLQEDAGEHERIKTKVKWKDVEVEARIYPEGSPYASSRTLVFVRDYLFEIYHSDGWVQIRRNDNPDYTQCTILAKSANSVVGMDAWYRIRMSVHGSRIRFWSNGSLALDIRDEAETEEMETVLGVFARPTYFDWVEVKEAEPDDDCGMIVTWDDGSQVRRIGFDGLIFSGSLPVPKDEPQFVETPFQARSGVVIS